MRHASRVARRGGAVRRGDGIKEAAAAVEKSLRRAQIGDEFAPWLETVRALSSPKRRRIV